MFDTNNQYQASSQWKYGLPDCPLNGFANTATVSSSEVQDYGVMKDII